MSPKPPPTARTCFGPVSGLAPWVKNPWSFAFPPEGSGMCNDR
jgi:hypothetical protein